jgi:Na+-driven multidrug efflux pump
VGWRRSLHYLASRRRWRAYLRQFLPSILSAMLNGWQYQVISFIAANRPEADIAAHNCALALFEISHALAVGLADSAAVRVGYHLGRGNAVAAKKAAIAAGCGTAGVAIAIAATGSLLRKYMGRMFSGDEEVVGIIESLADPFWLAFMCLCVGTVLLQVLAGQGRVRVQSGIYLISGYVVAVPGAFISYFVVNGGQGYGLLGLWYSLVAGNATLLALALFLVGRSDWPALAAFACAQQDRAEAAAAAAAAGAAPPETRQRPGVASKAATRREGVLAELDAEDEAANLEHLTRAREHAAPPTPLPLSSNSGRWNAA